MPVMAAMAAVSATREQYVWSGFSDWFGNDPVAGFVIGFAIAAAAFGVGALIGTIPDKPKPKKKNKSDQAR